MYVMLGCFVLFWIVGAFAYERFQRHSSFGIAALRSSTRNPMSAAGGNHMPRNRLPKPPAFDFDESPIIRFIAASIKRKLAHDPTNPDALETLAWLNSRREQIRKADPRTYAGRQLPESLTRLLQG
jgi:hypothetical protein